MNASELSAMTLEKNLAMVKKTLEDFTDADMVVRPAPSANNAAWQLGHLVVSENNVMAMIAPGVVPPLPAGMAERFTKQTTGVNDIAALATKEQLLSAFERTRLATIAWTRALTSEQFDKPGPEKLQRLGATVGALAAFQATHGTMHLGQFQVIRRTLNKPVLF